MSDQKPTHVVVSAPSQWGQQACDHLLHRAVAHGGRVTLIVPRREQKRFEEIPPSIKEWQDLPSLKVCLEQRRASGRPIDFVYDDQCNHLAAELISQRTSKSHLTVGYVTSSAEGHLHQARYLSRFCDRVLVEKPVSRVFSEIRPDGGFPKLAEELEQASDRKCLLRTAEHYLFRPGVTAAIQSKELKEFVDRHRGCDLRYEFRFEEPAGRDDPTKRLAAYQDGSILDILAPHGLGPLACLLIPMLGIKEEDVDFYTNLTWKKVRSWQAAEPPKGLLKVPVLSETAAELCGSLRLSETQTIHIELRSAKGCKDYSRYFMLYCPADTCHHIAAARDEVVSDIGLRPGSPAATPSLYFGVSLGSEGFTVLDYDKLSPLRQHFLEQRGGYQSDSRGSVSEAANAQAAMLDAFLTEEWNSQTEQRFASVERACQLVRVGLRAQGVAFKKKRGNYVWGEGPWDQARSGPKKERTEARIIAESNKDLKHQAPGVEQLKEVLGPSSYHRIVTILGPEGTGNSDVARVLTKELNAFRIDIPRDEDWDTRRDPSIADSPPPSNFTLEMVLRELATHLPLPLTTVRRPAEELLAYLRVVGASFKGANIILFNGVDRLPVTDWHILVRVLNQLPATYRMIFVTKEWGRAAGFVVRTEEVMQSLPSLAHLSRTPSGDAYFPHALAEQQAEYERLWNEVSSFSKQNLTVKQQVASYLFYIAVPAGLWKARSLNPEPALWEQVRIYIQDEMASLDVPTPLTPNPEAFLDRVSMLSLAMVSEMERVAVRSLAAVSGHIPKALVNEVLPGLFENLINAQPVRALFEEVTKDGALLFPRVRKAVLTCRPRKFENLRVEIERRRLILLLRRLRLDASGESDRRRSLDEQMIRLLYGASLKTLNLEESLFEACCMELIEGLETSSDLHGHQAAGSLIELLAGKSSSSKTNLGLLARARLTRLKGWLLRSAAGTDPARHHEAAEVLDHALALAQHCAIKENRPSNQGQDQRVRETLVLAIQGRVFAGLVQSRCWHHLLGVKTMPLVKDQDWEKFVTPDCAEKEQSLWKLCGLNPDAKAAPQRSNLSGKVCAIALRVLALYMGTRWKKWNDERPVRLCLWASQLNEGQEDCRARNLLEAAIMLGGDKAIEDNWNLNFSSEGITRKCLQDKANHIFEPEQKLHPGLDPYMRLLNLVLCRKPGATHLDPAEIEHLNQLETAFKRTGEAYFSELARDMKS